MSRILLSAAVLALVVSLPNLVIAQNYCANDAYTSSYFGGAGLSQGYGGQGIGGVAVLNRGFYSANSYNSFHRPENVPYFAMYPPVYYSADIVKRPYGVSPYAAPAGVVPAEYQLQQFNNKPLHIVNPYAHPDLEAPIVVPGHPIDPNSVPALDDTDEPTQAAPGSNDAAPADNKKSDEDWEIVPDKDKTEA